MNNIEITSRQPETFSERIVYNESTYSKQEFLSAAGAIAGVAAAVPIIAETSQPANTMSCRIDSVERTESTVSVSEMTCATDYEHELSPVLLLTAGPVIGALIVWNSIKYGVVARSGSERYKALKHGFRGKYGTYY